MVKSLLLAFSGSSVIAEHGCVDKWCSVKKHVVELPSTFASVSLIHCRDLCLFRDGSDCEGFSLDPQEGVCTHYKFHETGILSDVYAYFPIVDLAKALPETNYVYKQIGEPKSVTGLDQCRDLLSASSLGPVFANFGNQACGTEQPTPTATILDGEYLEKEGVLIFTYQPPATALGAAQPEHLTLFNHGFKMSKSIQDASEWVWSNGGVFPAHREGACLAAQNVLTPVSMDTSADSRCGMNMSSGSPWNRTDVFGWHMQNTSDGTFKCMGDITKNVIIDNTGIKYDLIAIEDPDVKTRLCNQKWQVSGRLINKNNPVLLARSCDAGALDGAWVDGQPYPPGDFSPQWFDKLTISSSENQLLAHTKEGDANVPYSISVDGCSITVYLQKGCDDCIATGTMSEGGETINWDSGFNDGDFWVRKNQGCCTLFDAILKSPSNLASPTLGSRSAPNDAACVEQFSGRWVDNSKGDFNFSWVPYMDLSGGRPEDEVEDDSNGRMTAPIEQGSWVLPVKFFEEGGMCKLKLCLEKQCPGESYAIGTLEADEIHWDERLNHGKWVRFGDNPCSQTHAKYSCCDATGKVGCAFAPNKAVCDRVHGTFCCDPLIPHLQCGFEPSTITKMPTLV